MKVLIIGNDATKYEEVTKKLSDKDIIVSACSYQDLAFFIDGDSSFVKIYTTGEDIKDFSKIIVLATSPAHLQNYIFSALACYCRKNNITILDDNFSNLDGKLYALWRFWEKDIPVAKTAFGPVDYLVEQLKVIGTPAILKSVKGTKGKDSFLIHSGEEIRQAIEQNEDARFVLQNFIENDGDWRIVLVNFEPKLAIYRTSHGKDFRNNTSVGGDATLIPLPQVDPKVLQIAIDAAKALDIKIAGADILPDKNGNYTVLEVNRTPQLVTGAFTEAKLEVIKNLIHS